MKVPVIPIVIGALVTVTKRLIMGLDDLERTRGDYPNYSIVEIGQNFEKGPRDLRIYAVTQTPVRNNRLTLV